jgi:hypothetical protein
MRWHRRFKSYLLRARSFFETRPGTVQVVCEHFRGSTNQHAIPNRRTSAKEKKKPFKVVHDDLANYSLAETVISRDLGSRAPTGR